MAKISLVDGELASTFRSNLNSMFTDLYTHPTSYIYVGKNGNDTDGDGSPLNPYLTISKAITEATSGTTIFVFPGTYTEDLTMKAGVNISTSTKFSVYVVGTVTMNITGTVYAQQIVFKSSTGKVLNFIGTTAQNFQALACNFESLTGNANDAIYYSNTNASSKITLTDCVVTTYTSTTAKAINVVTGSAGSAILANTTVQLVDNPDHVCIYLGGSIAYTHTLDQIVGQVVTANTAHATASMLTISTTTVPTLVHNSTSSTPTVLANIITTTSAIPAVTGVGALVYAGAFYAGTGSGGAATLNGGLGPLPFDMASIKFRTQAALSPAGALAAGLLNGTFEFTASGLYFDIGTTRYKIDMTAV
jgi:hypothetical protein